MTNRRGGRKNLPLHLLELTCNTISLFPNPAMRTYATALLTAVAACAAATPITDSFLDAVAVIESNNNPNAVGDSGRAIGAYQMHQPAFREACQHLAKKTGMHSFWMDNIADDHRHYAKQPSTSRIVARAYFQILESRMLKDGIKPTKENLYMAYNMGYAGARKHRFNPYDSSLDKTRARILARACNILNR